MSTDETNDIVKCSERIVKVKDSFAVLEEESLTKSEQLPKLLSTTICFSSEATLRVMTVKYTPTCASYIQRKHQNAIGDGR